MKNRTIPPDGLCRISTILITIPTLATAQFQDHDTCLTEKPKRPSPNTMPSTATYTRKRRLCCKALPEDAAYWHPCASLCGREGIARFFKEL